MGRKKGVKLKIWAEYEPPKPEATAEKEEEKVFTGDDQRSFFSRWKELERIVLEKNNTWSAPLGNAAPPMSAS